MPLLLSITICAISSIAYALPQVAPITTSVSRAAATASAPEETESVETVTVKYDVGSTTFVDVKTYTDYGSILPSDLTGNGARTADLATQTDPVSIVRSLFLPFSSIDMEHVHVTPNKKSRDRETGFATLYRYRTD